jgi:nitronate monooxygenase
MSLDPTQRNSLVLPVVCAPMAGVSGPDLVREACKAGIMGVLPRHNAVDIAQFGDWLRQIRQDLDGHQERFPAAIIGPLAVNFSRRWTADEMRANLDLCARYGVDVIRPNSPGLCTGGVARSFMMSRACVSRRRRSLPASTA